LAGLHAGVFAHGDDLAQRWACERVFEPQMSRDQAQAKMAQWEHAVRQTRLN
jgi:glycerol kinase